VIAALRADHATKQWRIAYLGPEKRRHARRRRTRRRSRHPRVVYRVAATPTASRRRGVPTSHPSDPHLNSNGAAPPRESPLAFPTSPPCCTGGATSSLIPGNPYAIITEYAGIRIVRGPEWTSMRPANPRSAASCRAPTSYAMPPGGCSPTASAQTRSPESSRSTAEQYNRYPT
jgi:hypothetical protein